MYQIDDSFTKSGDKRVTKIRWPDNAVDVIHISGCNSNSGLLTRFDKSGRKQYESLPWSIGGGNLIDRVATEVCKL
jgi:hypothetical protein